MYKIAYIDESKRDRDNFQRYLRASESTIFDLSVIEPTPNLHELVAFLIESHFQAVIVDFHLSEKNPTIKYDGWDLANEILSYRAEFPVFILTAYDNDAITSGDDVNLVYDKKSAIHSDNYRFLNRVEKQIQKFTRRVNDAESRILELLKTKTERPLSMQEEQELIDADRFIERSLNKKSLLPDELKNLTNDSRLDRIINLLEKVDSTIQKAESKK